MMVQPALDQIITTVLNIFKYSPRITSHPASLCYSDHEQHHLHLGNLQMPRFFQKTTSLF